MTVDGVAVSSTGIRATLQRGDVATAARHLGRPYSISGPVTSGAGRGRTLGFPTANIEPTRPVLVALGVYRGLVEVEGRSYPAVVNVGVRPTFETGRGVLVESYLIDQEADMYGRQLRIAFIARLRGEKRFETVEELTAQMERDVEMARELCAAFEPPR